MNQLNDEIALEKVVLIEDYRGRQMKSFQYLQTNPSMWKMCDIIDQDADTGILSFAIPRDYDVVTAYSNMIPKERAESIHNLVMGGQQFTLCELCGHQIKYPYPIKCDAKKIVLWVGSECVNNFSGAGFVSKKIVEFTDNTVRKIFKSWRGIAIAESWNNSKFYDIINNNTYAIAGRTAIRKDIWVFQNKLSKLQDFNVYPEEQKLRYKKMPFQGIKDINELSTRKILNLFKKAKKLGYNIPKQVEPFLVSKVRKN